MRLAQDLINKPIISINEGREIGQVEDLYFDTELTVIAALHLGSEGVFKRKNLFIKRDDVIVFGVDAVLVKETDCILDDESTAGLAACLRRDDLNRRDVDTPGGTKIGRVDDVILDAEAGIAGFSLTRVVMDGPVAENQAISRESVVDTGQEDGVMTVNLKQAEQTNLHVTRGALFSTPTVTATQPDDTEAMIHEDEIKTAVEEVEEIEEAKDIVETTYPEDEANQASDEANGDDGDNDEEEVNAEGANEEIIQKEQDVS